MHGTKLHKNNIKIKKINCICRNFVENNFLLTLIFIFMSIDIIKELVNNSDYENKSELLSILEQKDAPKYSNLDELLNDEKNTDLLKQLDSHINSKIGKARTKWDEELNKKLQEKNESKKEVKNPLFDEIKKENKEIKEMLRVLTGQQNKVTLEKYVDEQLKNSPKLKTLVKVFPTDTKEDIDLKIKEAKELYNDIVKELDQSPKNGNTQRSSGNGNIGKEFAEQKLKELENTKPITMADYKN